MKKLIIIAVLAVALFMLKNINPTLEDHKLSISAEINSDNPMWNDLEYKNYFVASVTSNIESSSMISLGFCNYIKVVDTKWITQPDNEEN